MESKPIEGFEGLYSIYPDGRIWGHTRNEFIKPSPNLNVHYLQVQLWKENKGNSKYLHRLVAQHFIPNPYNKPEVNHIDGDRCNPDVTNLEWCTRHENMQHAYDTGLASVPRKFEPDFYMRLCDRFIGGESLTDLALEYASALSSFSYFVREAAITSGREEEYESELYRQKCLRAKRGMEHKRMAVNQYTKEGNFIKQHESISEAARYLGKKSSGAISNNISGRTKSAYGFKWERTC